jgi:transcriptional regulator with XRE-family HTH domain
MPDVCYYCAIVHRRSLPKAQRANPKSLLDHFARAVRGAREADGISQSELARRAGVSASVISRIEAGIVRTPDDRTRDRVAVALGRSARVLYFLAEGYANSALDELDLDLPVLREAKAAYEREGEKAVPDDAAVHEEWEVPIFEAVIEYFVENRITDEVAPDVDPDTRWALEEFLHAWTGLTDTRKELLLRYMDDQLRLSLDDRRDQSRASVGDQTTPRGRGRGR